MSLSHWLQLALTEGIGPILTSRLVEAAGSAQAACEANASLLRSVEGIGPGKSQTIVDALRRAADQVEDELARAAAGGVSLICIEDEAYPEMLKVISDPPPVLYVRGGLEPRDLNGMAIVGSRRCTHYGREQAERFGALLAQAGFTIISGGARGVDSAAHRGALSSPSGRTISVLGCGVDIAYPPENHALFDQIAGRGAVLSEFPLSSPPLRENFPRRNRIISGLSRGVLVVEADVASGALITARQACDSHNRPVFAIPGRIDNAMSAGPHALIRDGAVLVTALEDIVDNLGPLPHPITSPAPEVPVTEEIPASPVMLDDRQQRILQGIDLDPTQLDTIIARTDLPAEIVMQELTMLTLRGVVKRVDGQAYVRKARG
ncbi:MAG TPA: DNA-processing protein DprA [Tepidisphaeraceae bacterium]|jgi:DNA processing protein|nr:DNA-processing protein DprA [Tepidisphaeraceae bacterium]